MTSRFANGRAAAILEGLAAVLLLALMIVVLIDVLGRNLLNRPLPWGTELLEVLLAVMIFALYPVLGASGGHITVDLISLRISIERVQRLVAGLLGATLFALIAWCLGLMASRAADYGESTPLLAIPYSAVLGSLSALSAVTTLGFLIATAAALRREPAAPHSLTSEGV